MGNRIRRRQWHPTPLLLPGKSHGWRSLVGYSPWGRRVGHDWSDLAAAAAALWWECRMVHTWMLSHARLSQYTLITCFSPEWKQCIYSMSTCAQALQFCLTLWDPMDCSLPGTFVHGILQTRMLEWVAMSSSRGSSQPRDRTYVS